MIGKSKSGKGLKKYEHILKHICNVKNIFSLTSIERDSCVGVAMVLAYMEGTFPSLGELSRHLGMSSKVM